MSKEPIKKFFSDVKQGEICSLSPSGFEHGYVNIRVPLSNVIDSLAGFTPFNVIALDGGRPRTFHDSDIVYVQEERLTF